MYDKNFIYILAVILGLIFGSFLNVLIYRLPRGKSIVSPPSSCPVCAGVIAWYSNIPVLSYLLQKGRCKHCKAKISIRYPLVELCTAIAFLGVAYKFDSLPLIVKYCIFSYLLLGAAFTDMDTRSSDEFDCGYIPDFYTIGGVLAGYMIALTFGDIKIHGSFAGSGIGVFSLLIVGFLYKAVRRSEGIGDGDALMMGMVGSFTGDLSILFVILFSSLLGAVVGIIVIRIKRDKNYAFPFGPMIAAAALFYIYAGDMIINRLIY